jgi:methylglutaconyl-CoA hydratase
MAAILEVKSHAPAGTIILRRPDQRNALTRQLIEEISQGLDDLRQERKVKAVILTGAGSAFCAGMDLREMQRHSESPSALDEWHTDSVIYRDLLLKMLRFPKPIIAAVNGPAIAGGAGLVLASDIVLAAKSATFGLPEPRRGLVAGMVAPLLNFRVGAGRSAELLLRANVLSAERAAEIGIFHELISDDLIWAKAVEIAGECGASAAEALGLTKRMLNETIGEHLEMQLSLGAAVSATARTTEAATEGRAAFLEKREPNWP